MNLISDDIVYYGIIPYLSHYDIFSCRNISKWWNQVYNTISKHYICRSPISQISSYNDPSLLREICRECGGNSLLSQIHDNIDHLFDGTHNILIDEIFEWSMFIDYVRNIFLKTYMRRIACFTFIDANMINTISRYITMHRKHISLMNYDNRLWIVFIYGLCDISADEYHIPDEEKILSLLDSQSHLINVDMILSGAKDLWISIH